MTWIIERSEDMFDEKIVLTKRKLIFGMTFIFVSGYLIGLFIHSIR